MPLPADTTALHRVGMGTIVDLSQPIRDGQTTYPGLPGPAISDHLTREASRERYAPGYEFQIGKIEMVSNTGTYLDTPFHRFPDGHDLSAIDLAKVVAVPGVVIDAPAEGPIEADVLAGRDVAGTAILFRTGWSKHFATEHYGDAAHPGLTAGAAEALVAAAPALVGIDSVNIDLTTGGERPVHTKLLAAGIYIVEHLTNLDQLPDGPFSFTAAPPAVVGMGTFPVRAFATF
jgi:kynurenine formamidase